MREKKLNGLRLKVLSLLVVIMFVSVAVVCPVVRSDESSAEETTDELIDAMPNEVLNEFIADELESISELTENELMEEYGVTMEEYQESMSALSGTTMALIGDENGEIRIEVSESIDRGRTGGWNDGLYFNFGIDSVAWSAIRWWFSDDCINMLTDQMCQGEINAVAIAEKEVQDEMDSIQALTKEIIDIGNTISKIEATIASLDASLASSYDDIDNLTNEMIQTTEKYNTECKAFLSSTEDDIALVDALNERISVIDADEIAYIAENCNNDPNICAEMLEEKMGIASGINVSTIMHIWDLRGYPIIIKDLIEGNYLAIALSITEGSALQTYHLIKNYQSGELAKIQMEYNNTKIDLINEKIRLQDEIADNDRIIETAKNMKLDIRNEIDSAKIENKELNNYLDDYEKGLKKANSDLSISSEKCIKEKESFDQIVNKYKKGEISLDEYKSEMTKYYDDLKDFWNKKITSMKMEVKVNQTKKSIEINNEKINEEKKLKISKSKEIKNTKLVKLSKKAQTLKNGLGAVKAGCKAAVKATAKAGCKAAICSTGIGAVLMIALDIVMALLIKFIEDHLQSWFEDYGIIVKVQTMAHYIISKTIRVFWHTFTIHIDTILPCVPRLDGVYMQ